MSRNRFHGGHREEHREAPVHIHSPAPTQAPPHAMPEQDFFVCLNEPAVFRRNLLEASKGSLVVIKGLYIIREIKARKQDKISQLQKEIREIRLLMQKAEELLPKHSRHDAAKVFPHVAEKKVVPAPTKPMPAPEMPHIKVVPQPMSELDRLSHSINDIDSKLKNLPGNKPAQAPVKSAPEAPKPAAQGNDLTAELGKTLEGIQKRLRQM